MIQHPPQIILFGGLNIQQGGRSVTRFRTRKTACLLAYLAFYRRRTHTREELADLFWPEDDPDAARASLRTALNSLRKQLGSYGGSQESVLESDRTFVRLRHDVITTDVAQFEFALAAAETASSPEDQVDALRRAVQLYRGDLLPEIYDNWILPEREQMSQAYTSAVRRLAELAADRGDLDHALEFTLRLVAADSTEEAARVSAMRIYQQRGMFYEAVKQYRELECILRVESGIEPSADVKAVYSELPERYRRAVGIRHSRRSASSLQGADARKPSEFTVGQRVPMLPMALTPFIGRTSETQVIAGLLTSSLGSSVGQGDPTAAARLFSLIGPGGSGKTRLAVEVVRQVGAHFHGPIWFTQLAGLSDARAIPDAVLDALGAPRTIHSSWIQSISVETGGSPCLLVLDNLEHLVPDACRYVHELLLGVPALTCLITSRSRLRIVGERVLQVSPLQIPAIKCKSTADLSACESVQLFVDRAQAARADFAVTDRNAAAIAELCRRLDGLPLALELAASWAQVLTPAQMLQRTHDRGELLSRYTLGVANRHKSLWATIAWSYEQLSSDQRRLFRQLAAFRSGWSVSAATAVCAVDPASDSAENRMLVDLTHLAEVSLVLTEEIETLRGTEIRFRMLETMREYALEQMPRDERTRIADRHARFFMEIAERYAADIHPKFRDSLDADYDNLIAALQWAVESSKADIAIRLATSMFPLWLWRRRHSEGRRFLEGVLSVPGLDAGLVAGALRAIGILCFYIEDYAAALEYFHRQLDIVRELNDAQAIASALSNMAIAEQGLGRAHKAKQLMDESLERLIVLGEADRIPCAHFNLADIHEELGELDKARDLYILGLRGYAAVDSASGQAMCCARLGMLAKRYGDLAAAKALFERALQFEATLGKPLGHPDTLKALAETLDSLGQHEAAIAAVARRELALADEYDLSNS